MDLAVSNPHSAKAKHDRVAIDGNCFRYSKANVRGYANEYRRCDDTCTARDLDSPEISASSGIPRTVCGQEREHRSRKRLDVAYDLLGRSPTEPTQKIVEMVQVLSTGHTVVRHAVCDTLHDPLGHRHRHIPHFLLPDRR